MGQTLEQFAAACKKALTDQPGPEGRKKVRDLLRDILANDKAFVAKYVTDETPERKVLYEDPDLGFTILAHNNRGAKGSSPHDHGPSWAIYGQAEGETLMADWMLVQTPFGEAPGQVRHVRDYSLKPGDAHFYDIGVLHSPERKGPTKLIRIEGQNMERVKRAKFVVIQ